MGVKVKQKIDKESSPQKEKQGGIKFETNKQWITKRKEHDK